MATDSERSLLTDAFSLSRISLFLLFFTTQGRAFHKITAIHISCVIFVSHLIRSWLSHPAAGLLEDVFFGDLVAFPHTIIAVEFNALEAIETAETMIIAYIACNADLSSVVNSER